MDMRFPDAPARIQTLPVSDKGFPIPWFVADVGNGVRDFRVADNTKIALAVQFRKCWICGQTMGKFMASVIGPMCSITRTISEPPSHRDCAIFAAKHCPFLASPMAKRRAAGLPEEIVPAAGHGIPRNPGAVAVWIATSYTPFRARSGAAGTLFELSDPVEVLWFAHGRQATREEVRESIRTGYPFLIDKASQQGYLAMQDLQRRTAEAERHLPAA